MQQAVLQARARLPAPGMTPTLVTGAQRASHPVAATEPENATAVPISRDATVPTLRGRTWLVGMLGHRAVPRRSCGGVGRAPRRKAG